ncbi:hypothetical protein Csa_010280 [Cucumis sativus]|uniref:Uncharacterized protein n=1 Tax=Cucumis sativus TaxID=3659 RepID=A0A0A0LA61_CUCSA|nr:hypothetical protein Csa_010280 [Cucumis sativus]
MELYRRQFGALTELGKREIQREEPLNKQSSPQSAVLMVGEFYGGRGKQMRERKIPIIKIKLSVPFQRATFLPLHVPVMSALSSRGPIHQN